MKYGGSAENLISVLVVTGMEYLGEILVQIFVFEGADVPLGGSVVVVLMLALPWWAVPTKGVQPNFDNTPSRPDSCKGAFGR